MDFENRQEFRGRLARLQRAVDILLDIEGIKWDEKMGDYVEEVEDEEEYDDDNDSDLEEQKEEKQDGSGKSKSNTSKPKQPEE